MDTAHEESRVRSNHICRVSSELGATSSATLQIQREHYLRISSVTLGSERISVLGNADRRGQIHAKGHKLWNVI